MTQKTFFITGISSGLGLELTKKLLSQNHKVVGTYLGDSGNLDLLDKANLKYFEVDNLDYKKTAEIVNKVEFVDVFINNAGIYMMGQLEDCEPEKIIKLINCNLTGAILTTQAVVKKMKPKNKGIIFFVNSTNGVENEKLRTVYGASKWGLRGFASNLRNDLKDTEIKVFSFYPAGMQTDFFKNADLQTDTIKFMAISDVADLIIQTINNSDKYLVDEMVLHRWV